MIVGLEGMQVEEGQMQGYPDETHLVSQNTYEIIYLALKLLLRKRREIKSLGTTLVLISAIIMLTFLGISSIFSEISEKENLMKESRYLTIICKDMPTLLGVEGTLMDKGIPFVTLNVSYLKFTLRGKIVDSPAYASNLESLHRFFGIKGDTKRNILVGEDLARAYRLKNGDKIKIGGEEFEVEIFETHTPLDLGMILTKVRPAYFEIISMNDDETAEFLSNRFRGSIDLSSVRYNFKDFSQNIVSNVKKLFYTWIAITVLLAAMSSYTLSYKEVMAIGRRAKILRDLGVSSGGLILFAITFISLEAITSSIAGICLSVVLAQFTSWLIGWILNMPTAALHPGLGDIIFVLAITSLSAIAGSLPKILVDLVD